MLHAGNKKIIGVQWNEGIWAFQVRVICGDQREESDSEDSDKRVTTWECSWCWMKFTESPVNGRPVSRPRDNIMPIHLNGVLMSTTQFQPYRPADSRHVSGHAGHVTNTMPTIGHRTSSLEMLNNVTDFEEKRAFIASTLSLNDLLKPSSQEFRGAVSPSQAQFSPIMGSGYIGGMTSPQGGVTNGYMVPPSLLKPNTNGYNVNFLNNGTPDKDLGKCAVRYKLRKTILILRGPQQRSQL